MIDVVVVLMRENEKDFETMYHPDAISSQNSSSAKNFQFQFDGNQRTTFATSTVDDIRFHYNITTLLAQNERYTRTATQQK